VPKKPTEWHVADDGLPARVVGPWVDRKAWFVDALVGIFGTGMKRRWSRRAYLELFAGPGLSWDRAKHRIVRGSALRALSRDFTDYAYVDLDSIAVDALTKRVSALDLGDRRVSVLPPMDCNDAVPALRTAIPSDALTLAFIDPTNWQVRLDTIAALTEGRRVDLLVTFHIGSMKRVAHLRPRALTDFFGTDSWRSAFNRPHWEHTEALAELYNRQLEQLGYLSGTYPHRVAVRNSTNAVIYELIGFSKHDRGVDFWRKATRIDERGQTGFWS